MVSTMSGIPWSQAGQLLGVVTPPAISVTPREAEVRSPPATIPHSTLLKQKSQRRITVEDSLTANADSLVSIV